MKIGIASEKNDIKSKVCGITGRAPYYLIFEDKKLIKAIKNPFVYGGGGAGPSVAQMLYNEKVNLVIGGKFGEKMISALDEKEMKHKVIYDKTIEEFISEI